MSDTRRRRKQSGGSDDLSDSYDELNVTKETQSSEQTDARRDSEYDTAGSDADSDGGSQDGGERESGDGQEEDKPQRKLDDDEDRRNPQYIPKRGTFYEHDDRTSEETGEITAEPVPERETKEKKVWKDKEDRWNHDRYNDDEQAPKSHDELIAVYGYDIRNEEGPPRARRRRRYGRGPNKYTRNWEDEDAYGKTAGSGSVTGGGKNPGKRNNRSGEEFPALGGTNTEASTESMDEPVISSAWYSNKNKTPSTKQQNFPPLQSQQDNHKPKTASSNSMLTSNENRTPNEPNNPAWKKEPKSTMRNPSPNRNAAGGGGGDTDKFINTQLQSPRDNKDPRKRQVHESVSLAANRARGRGYKPGANNNLVAHRTQDIKPKGRGAGLISGEPRRNNATSHREDDLQQQHQQLGTDIKHQIPNDGLYNPSGRPTKNFHAQSPVQQRPNTVPPRMQQQQQPPLSQGQQQVHSPQQQQQQHQQQQLQQQSQADVTGNRPKRYSSLRRPTIPEGPTQPQPPYAPQHPQHGFYPPQAGNSHGVLESQGFPQAHFEQPAPVGNSGAPMAGQPVIPLAPGGQPAGYAPAPFLVPPPQFIAPQAAPPNIINYVPTPAGPPFQPNFQGYQSYNPTVPPQGPPPPPELFQPQGCTYYSPAQQQQQQAPLRRPKAAIPILPPPDTSSAQQYHQGSRGRGRTPQNAHTGVIPGNMSLSSGVSTPQNQENDETPPSTVPLELETKNEVAVVEYDRFEEQTTAAPFVPAPQSENTTTSTKTNTSTTITDSEKIDVVAVVAAEKSEPESIVIQSATSEESAKISPPEMIEKKQETLVSSNKEVQEEVVAKPTTMAENTEIVATTNVAIVASNPNPKIVEIDVTIDEGKVSEPEKNVVMEKPVVEETAA